MSKLLSLLTLKAFLMLLIILFAGVGLSPDEAQYWSWSRHLDVGYYSKPPGIAWEIFSTTSLLGTTELGVRFGPIILGTLFALAVYRLAKVSKLSETASFFAALFAALTPMGFFSTFLAITDGGMLLFWTLGLTELAHSIAEKDEVKWARFGLWIALGALFKWPIYILWAVALAKERRISKEMLIGILVSLIGLIPTMYWNASHDFVTFRHVFTIVSGGNDGGGKANPFEFIATQGALLSPLIFAMMIFSWFKMREKSLSDAARFLGLSSFILLGVFILYSFFKKGQGNWCLFVYPGAFVFLAAVFESYKKLFWAAISMSVAMAAFAFAIPTISFPWKMNPFRHNLGWHAWGEKLTFDSEKEFLFSDKYQVTAELMFYAKGQPQVYFFNLLNLRQNQYSFWPSPTLKDGVFVAVEQAPKLEEKLGEMKSFYPKLLSDYFTEVGPPEIIDLRSEGEEVVKSALVYRCKGWSGKLPRNPDKY